MDQISGGVICDQLCFFFIEFVPVEEEIRSFFKKGIKIQGDVQKNYFGLIGECIW